MVMIEPPKFRKVTPSLVDLANIQDAEWRPMTRFEIFMGKIKWKFKNRKNANNTGTW